MQLKKAVHAMHSLAGMAEHALNSVEKRPKMGTKWTQIVAQ